MNKSEKIQSLEKYLQSQKDRLAAKSFPKRDTTEFLKIDIAKTERKIAKLRTEV